MVLFCCCYSTQNKRASYKFAGSCYDQDEIVADLIFFKSSTWTLKHFLSIFKI